VKAAIAKASSSAKSAKANSITVKPKERDILQALGKLYAAQVEQKHRSTVAALAGQSKTPEGFKKTLGSLKKKGLITYGSNDTLDLTDAGIEVIGYTAPLTNQDFQEEVIKQLVSPKGWTIVQHIIDREVYNKNQVATDMGYDMNKLSGFEKDLSKLKKLGFLDKTSDTIQLTGKCFPCDE
jgi:hypothetical protein